MISWLIRKKARVAKVVLTLLLTCFWFLLFRGRLERYQQDSYDNSPLNDRPAFPVPSPEENVKAMDKEMADRRDLMNRMCSQQVGVVSMSTSSKDYYVKPYDFYVCLVAKIASTFMSRFLYQLHHTHPIESPFNVDVFQAYNGLSEVSAKDQHVDIMNVSTKLVFVREPYGRLVSAYIDKLLPPNPAFWTAWGRPAVMKFRENRPDNGFVHGNDTTFAEFISFAVTRGFSYDVHLIPIHKKCNPCRTKYTAIGKMETFEQDAKYIISQLGISEKRIGFDRMREDQEVDALNDSTNGSFSSTWLRSTLKVISREAAAQRMWRKLQIRGFISWRQRLSLTSQQKANLSQSELLEMLKEARRASTNPMELKLQKKQAFVEAYRSLTPAHLQGIQSVYGPDFQLFGYEMDIAKRMADELPHYSNTNSLDWWKDWDLAPVLNAYSGGS